jgi:THO complex subunit 2
MGYTALLVLLSTPSTFDAAPKIAWERILEIIGMYDLSPPRVLDIILDAFCVFLEKEWEWFMGLMKESPWGVVDVGIDDMEMKVDADVDVESPLLSWKFGDDVKREKGNRILSQVVGFKYTFYQVSGLAPRTLYRAVG